MIGCARWLKLVGLSLAFCILAVGGATAAPTLDWTPTAAPPYREHAGFLTFNDRLWVLGGNHDSVFRTPRRGIWWSEDGDHWNCSHKELPFAASNTGAYTVFQGDLWAVSATTTHGEIWRSHDGENWDLVTSSTAFSFVSTVNGDEGGHAALVTFKNRLWLFGADDAVPNCVWSSANGLDWTLETSKPEFPWRDRWTCLAYDDQLWVIGGSSSTWPSPSRDDWVSTDGAHWYQKPATPFPARIRPAAAVFHDQIWIAGGLDRSHPLSDIWTTDDGTTWTRQPDQPDGFAPLGNAAVFKDQLWFFARFGNQKNFQLQLISTDGTDWKRHDAMPLPDYYYAPCKEGINGRLWTLGIDGLNYASARERIFSTVDGTSWTIELDPVPWVSRTIKTWVPLDGTIYSFGDEDRLWKSTDCVHWDQIETSPSFDLSLVYCAWRWQDAIYAGVYADPGLDIWKTQNGIDWTQVATQPDWDIFSSTPIDGHQVYPVVGESRVYLFNMKNYVHVSTDCVHWMTHPWTPDDATTRPQDFAPLFLTVGDTLVQLTGSHSSTGLFGIGDQARYSLDGAQWRPIQIKGGFEHGIYNSAVEFDDKFWIVGNNNPFVTNSEGLFWSPIPQIDWSATPPFWRAYH